MKGMGMNGFRMRMLWMVCVAALGVCGMAQDKAKPAPDVILFTNGDQLTGTVERGVGDNIVFKSDMAGELTIPLA